MVAEIFPAHLRTQAVSIAVTAVFLSDVLWLELEPTAQARIGWKYYLVFACLGLAHTVYLYFYLPEVSTIQTSIQRISSNSNLTEF